MTTPTMTATIDRWLSEMKAAAAHDDAATVAELARRVEGLMLIHQWAAMQDDDDAT